jgi:hypothetical protein
MFTKDQLELSNFDLDDLDESMYLEDKEVDFWNKNGYDPRKVWDGFKVRDDYKVHYEIYDGALDFLNEKMKELGKPLIKSINDDYGKGDLILIKDGSNYHVGAYDGVFTQIIRENVEVPKSEIEIELDRIRDEKQAKIDALKGNEMNTKTDREIYLESVAMKNEKHFKGFKEAFNLDPTMEMEKLFVDVPEAKGAFETYVQSIENAIDGEVAEYLDVDTG